MTTYAGEIVRRSDGAVVDAAAVSVTSGETFDNVIEDELISGDLWLPEGQSTLFKGLVEVEGNILLKGPGTRLAARPGNNTHVKIIGGDPSLYVGGGMDYDSGPYPNDLGIWVWGGAALDIQGTPKASWNRTGVDPTWGPGDEYYSAPTGPGNFFPQPWSLGDAVPRRTIDPATIANMDGDPAYGWFPPDWRTNGVPTEIINATRDVVIEGAPAGHIHIHSDTPQTLKHFRLEGFGIIRPNERASTHGEGDWISRYGLHFHHSDYGGPDGTVVEGVVAVNSRGRVFVPHGSRGITFRQCASVNSWSGGMWWDHFLDSQLPAGTTHADHETHDLLIDEMCIAGVDTRQAPTSDTARYDGMTLPSGTNLEIRNSAVSGVINNKLSVGYDWVTGGAAPDNPVWKFDTRNVAHNCRGPGLRFWTNLDHIHPVAEFLSYDCQDNGAAEFGAYLNRVQVRRSVYEGGYHFQHANSKDQPDGVIVEDLLISTADIGEPAIVAKGRNLPAHDPSIFRRVHMVSGSGQPKVWVLDGKNPWRADFIDCDVEPNDFVFEPHSGGDDDGLWVRIIEGGTPLWEYNVVNQVGSWTQL